MNQKQIMTVAGCVAATIVISLVILTLGSHDVPIVEKPKEPAGVEIGPQTLGNIEIAYKINTVCELLYGFSTGEYPNGEKMSTLKMAELIKKYPDEFAPWKATLENNETATEFFGHRLTDDFVDVLTDITMKESSINPDLKPIMRSAFTLQKNQIMLETFEQYDCQSYYDTKVPH